MKDSQKPEERVADAEARVKLFEELGNGATLLKKTKASFLKGTNERRLLNLMLDAAFFVSVRHLDGFREFLNELEKVKSGMGSKRKRVVKRDEKRKP